MDCHRNDLPVDFDQKTIPYLCDAYVIHSQGRERTVLRSGSALFELKKRGYYCPNKDHYRRSASDKPQWKVNLKEEIFSCMKMEENPAVIDDSIRSSSSPESPTRPGPIYLEEGSNRENSSMNTTRGEGNGRFKISRQQWSASQPHRRASCLRHTHGSYGSPSDFSKRASDDSLGKCNSSLHKQHENNINPGNSTEHEEKSSCVPDYFSSYEEFDKRHSASTSSREIRSSGDVLFRLMESLEMSNTYIRRNLHETSLNQPGSASTTEGDSSPNNMLKGNVDPRKSRRQDGARMRRRLKTSRTMLQDTKQKAASTTKQLPTSSCDQKPIYSNTDEGEKLLNESRDNTIELGMQLKQRLGFVCKSEKTPFSTSSTNQSSPRSEEEVNDMFFVKVFGDKPRESDTSSHGNQKPFPPRDVDNESRPAFFGRRKNADIDGHCSLPGAASLDSESYSSVISRHTALLNKNMAGRNFWFVEPSKMEEDEARHTGAESTASKKSQSQEKSAFHISKDSSGPARYFHKRNSWFSERKEIGCRSKQDSLKSVATVNTGSTDTTINAPSPDLEKHLREERPPTFFLGRGRSLSAGSPRSGIHEGEGRVIRNAGDKTTSEPETTQIYYTTYILNQKSSCTPSPSRTPSLSPSGLRDQRSLPFGGTRKEYEGTFTNSTERSNRSEVTSTCTGEIRSPYEEESLHLQFVRKDSPSPRSGEYSSGRGSYRCSVGDLHLNIGSRENDTMDASSLTSSISTAAENSCSARTKMSTATEGSQKINKNESARLRRRLKLNKISPETFSQSQSQFNTMPVRKVENEMDRELLESKIFVNQQEIPTIQSADETMIAEPSTVTDMPIPRRVIKLPPLVRHKKSEADSICVKSAKISSIEDLSKSEEITKNLSSTPVTEDIEIPSSSMDVDSESQTDAESSLEVMSSIECTPRDTSFSEQRLEPKQLITHISEDEKREKEEICGHKVENTFRIDNDSALTKDLVIHDENESQISSGTSDIVRNMFKHNYLYYDSEESEERPVTFKVGSFIPRKILVKLINRTEADCHAPEISFPHLKTHDTENVVMPMETGDFHLTGETSNKHAYLATFEERRPVVDKNSFMSVFQVKVPVPQEKEDSIYSLSTDSTPSTRRCCCLRRTCKAIRNFFFAPTNKHYY